MTTTEALPPNGNPRRAPASPGWWACILDVALVLWILRVPVATTVLGWLLLGWTPQAQDLFTEFSDLFPLTWQNSPWTCLRMLAFVLVLTLVWALPTHYAARLLLSTDPRAPALNGARCFRRAALHVPRLLGFLTFLAVELAIWRSYANLPTLDESNVIRDAEKALIVIAVLVAAAAVAYWVWVLLRPRGFERRGSFGRLVLTLAGFWQSVSPGRVADSTDELNRDIGRLVLTAVFVVFLIIFLAGADYVGTLFPRAMAVPFILGGWLPFLSYLSALGRQIRAPLITGLAALILIVAAVFGDNHTVRRVEAEPPVPLPIEQAVKLWMAENGCGADSRPDLAASPCPRPVIVAAAGGASRAAFMMASIIGYFLDTTEAQNFGVTGLTTQEVRNRIFAISSVSGGSVGAVMVAAALDAAPPASGKHPCVETPVDQWWGRKVGNWRDCLEALTSGDFLTADFFGFAFNDVFPFAPRDRAAVLEDSWRNRFRDVVPAAGKAAAPAPCQGLDCPFLSLQPRPGHWVPLLVINGTSEATGGRIMTTPLQMTYAPQEKCPTATGAAACPLFVQTDRFHQLLKTDVPSEGWKDWLGFVERFLLGDASKRNDVKLSTAAHNSARFPFISPPGSIRNHDNRLVDRIVDGGYFENYGALSAKELALAIHAIAPQLNPLVIVISNDPADLLDPSDDAVHDQHGQPRPFAANGEVFTEVNAPINTFANARTAHGILAVDQLSAVLHAAIPDCNRLVIKLRVWPDGNKPLSMSWWESPLVQRQIHRQTEQGADPDPKLGADSNQNGPHLRAIWQELKASSCRAPGTPLGQTIR